MILAAAFVVMLPIDGSSPVPSRTAAAWAVADRELREWRTSRSHLGFRLTSRSGAFTKGELAAIAARLPRAVPPEGDDLLVDFGRVRTASLGRYRVDASVYLPRVQGGHAAAYAVAFHAGSAPTVDRSIHAQF